LAVTAAKEAVGGGTAGVDDATWIDREVVLLAEARRTVSVTV
jgi:hypothetical protein